MKIYLLVEFEWLLISFAFGGKHELGEEVGGICGLNVDECRPFLW